MIRAGGRAGRAPAALPLALAAIGAWTPVAAVLACMAVASSPASASSPGDSVSVVDCVALARRAAPEVRALGMERDAARLDSLAARFNRRPTTSLFGGATVVPPNAFDPVVTNLGEYQLKAGVELPLRDGGARRRERASAALHASSATLEVARGSRDAGLRAAEIALDLLRMRETGSSLAETLDWLDRLEVLVSAGVRAGSRPRSDADRVAIERDAVRADLETLEQTRAERARELAELLGAHEGAPPLLDPERSAEAPPVPADSLALIEKAARSPEVLAAGLAERTQELALDEARHRNALALGVEADAGWWGADLTHAVPPDFALEHPGATFADRLRGDFGVSLALNFRRPLFDASARMLTSARVREREAAATRAATARAARERAMLDLMGRWQSAARRLALAESSTARAEDHSLRLRSLYAAGATTLLELLDARRQLDDARGRRADARFECRLARWERDLS